MKDVVVLRTGASFCVKKKDWENTLSNEGRLQTRKAWEAGVNAAQHKKVDPRTSRYAETYADWQRSRGYRLGTPCEARA